MVIMEEHLKCVLKNVIRYSFLDLPTNVCLAGAEGRIGSEREDMPWQEEELSAEFRDFIINFSRDEIPEINEMLRNIRIKILLYSNRGKR